MGLVFGGMEGGKRRRAEEEGGGGGSEGGGGGGGEEEQLLFFEFGLSIIMVLRISDLIYSRNPISSTI